MGNKDSFEMRTKLRFGMKCFSTSSVRGKRDPLHRNGDETKSSRASGAKKSLSAPLPTSKLPGKSTAPPAGSKVRVTSSVRLCAKQAHTRMKFDSLQIVPLSTSRPDLIATSVKRQSMVQYDSRLRTLGKYLAATRPGGSADILSCTKEEFFSFLYNWKLQKKGPAGTTRSALVKQHDVHGIYPSFCRDRDTVLAVEGAGANCEHVDKAVLSPEQRDVFLDAVLYGPDEALGSCALCKKNGCGADFRLRLQIEAEFLWEVPVRLTDAGHLKLNHFNDSKRPRWVFVEGLKTAPHGGNIIVNDDGWDLFEAGAALTTNDFLFPKCGAQHLGAIVQWCQVTHEWEDDLAWVAYTMRHTGMNKRERKVEEAVSELIHNVSRPVSKGYSRPNSERRRKLKS